LLRLKRKQQLIMDYDVIEGFGLSQSYFLQVRNRPRFVSILQKFCVKLSQIHEALWQLYYNGRGPFLPLKRHKSSTRYIMQIKKSRFKESGVEDKCVEEVKSLLVILKLGFTSQKTKY
jgi:hypothetical protein